MKTIVTYKSKYGSTKQYAEWLSEELQCEAVDLSEINAKKLEEYDVIIHGGGLYAKGIAGISFYKKRKEILTEKQFYIFAVGASPYSDKILSEIKKQNLKDVFDNVPLFYCEGNYNYPIMTPTHKMMMRMMNSMVEKHIKEGVADDYEKDLHEFIFDKFEHIDRKFLAPILERVKG